MPSPPPPPCAYAHHDGTAGGVRCAGPVLFTAHDRRGCRAVCFAHATWLQSHSIMPGHSKGCAGFPAC